MILSAEAGGFLASKSVSQGYAATIGPPSTPPTVLVGTVLIVISGAWMAWSVLSRPSTTQAATGAAAAQPRVR